MTNETGRKNRSVSDLAAQNPLALVAGGAALGVIAGALLPRTEKEREVLAPVGQRLAQRTSDTITAAKEAGRAEIEALIPNRESTKEKVSQLIGNVIDASKHKSEAREA